jgi:hypothetical protein
MRLRHGVAPPFIPSPADLARTANEAEVHRLVEACGGWASPIILNWQKCAAEVRLWAKPGHELTLQEWLETLSKGDRPTYWAVEARRALGKSLYFEPAFDGEIEFDEEFDED